MHEGPPDTSGGVGQLTRLALPWHRPCSGELHGYSKPDCGVFRVVQANASRDRGHSRSPGVRRRRARRVRLRVSRRGARLCPRSHPLLSTRAVSGALCVSRRGELVLSHSARVGRLSGGAARASSVPRAAGARDPSRSRSSLWRPPGVSERALRPSPLDKAVTAEPRVRGAASGAAPIPRPEVAQALLRGSAR